MNIIEYNSDYEEDVKDLLVELEEYIVSIDKDELDQVGENYREEMIKHDLDEVYKYNGKCYIATQDNKAIGVIMGVIRPYEEIDKLDFKCPKMGEVTELVVSKNIRSKGIGSALMSKMEDYFKEQNCEYITIDVFAYNNNAIKFYESHGYHPRMLIDIKKIK